VTRPNHNQHSIGQHSIGLAVHNATLAYNNRTVSTELSFVVPASRFTAIIGPNGCGKSTLLRALSRTLKPLEGTVTLDGQPLTGLRPRELAKRLAILPQDPVAPDSLRVRDLVSRGRHPYHSAFRQWLPGDAALVDRAMSSTGINDLADRFVAELSGGQRQRVWLAMILAQDTDYVLLDEPTSFLDISHQIELLHLCQDIRDSGRTVVAVLHDLNQAARYADQLVVMAEGSIVAQGRPSDVITPELVGSVFSLPCEVVSDPQSGAPMVIPLAR
jgi:iron complex transport system ATP-binding protein